MLIGFDPWDCQYCQASLDQKLSQLNMSGGSGKWLGEVLLSEEHKRKVASLALVSIKRYLARPHWEAGVGDAPPKNPLLDIYLDEKQLEIEITQVVKGINLGTDRIKQLTRMRLSQNGHNGTAPPAGLKSRAKKLGWA
jgi:hypothetical protein